MDRRTLLKASVLIPLMGFVAVDELPEWQPFVEPKDCCPGDYAEATDGDNVKRTWLVLKACRPIGICEYGLVIEFDGSVRLADSSFLLQVSKACPV